jgi:hypothetical protein
MIWAMLALVAGIFIFKKFSYYYILMAWACFAVLIVQNVVAVFVPYYEVVTNVGFGADLGWTWIAYTHVLQIVMLMVLILMAMRKESWTEWEKITRLLMVSSLYPILLRLLEAQPVAQFTIKKSTQSGHSFPLFTVASVAISLHLIKTLRKLHAEEECKGK